MNNDYRFVTRWRVQATAEEVYRLIDDPLDFVRWWPSVWLRVDAVDDERGGRTVRFLSKGWLPYLLRWSARTVEREPFSRLVVDASGDFDGEGRWSFTTEGSEVTAEYVWTIRANKPLLRYLSFLMRPLFAANHHWAMARGEESLRLELARRHARSDAERARIPPPPPPTFMSDRRRQALAQAAAR